MPGPQGEGQGGSSRQHRGSGEGFAPGAEVAMSPRPALGTGQCHPEARRGQKLRDPCALGHHQTLGAGWARRLEPVPLSLHLPCPAATGSTGPKACLPGDKMHSRLSCYGCCGHSPGGLQRGVGARSRTSLPGRQEHGGTPGHGETQPLLPSAHSSLSSHKGPGPQSALSHLPLVFQLLGPPALDLKIQRTAWDHPAWGGRVSV